MNWKGILMNHNESLTFLTNKPGNVKNAIIQKLSKQWPLTIKKLYQAIKREFGMNVTYQAVHKALHELEDNNILEKTEDGYQLHENWIKEINQIANNIAKTYSRNEPLDFNKEIIQLHFKKWIEVGRFGAFTFKSEFPNPKNEPIITCWMHVWPVSTVSAEESKQLLEQTKKGTKLYCVCTNDTPLDRLFADWIGKMGRKNVLGAKIPLDHDYIVNGDYIAQIYYDDKFRKKIDSFYRKNKDIKNIDYQRLQEIATEKTDIQVVVIKNSVMASKFREKSTLLFPENKISTK